MKNENFDLKQILTMFMDSLSYCEFCDSKLQEFKFEDLPEEIKKEFSSHKNNARFLYCKKCNEYTMQSYPQFG